MSKARDLARAGTALTSVDATELGYLDGVTSSVQTQLNGKQAVVSGVNDTEIGYLDGVTSAIQTQLDAKAVYPSQTGNSGKFLTTNGSATSWGTVSTTKSFSLLSSASIGTSSSYTVSGLSGYDQLVINFSGISNTLGGEIDFRINGDTGANYDYGGVALYAGSSWSSTNISHSNATGDNKIVLSQLGGAAGFSSGTLIISGANTSGKKVIQHKGGASGTGSYGFIVAGVYHSTSVISSITFFNASGNFDAGTVYIYGAA